MELVGLRQALEYQDRVLQNEIVQKYEAEVSLLDTNLVEQLEGKIEVNSDRGTQIEITFVEQNYEARI